MFKWLFKKKGCAKHMNNKLEVIGIDHGWSMMKTISQVFVTGVKEITTTPALFGDVLEYEGKFYKVGAVRQEVKDTKVEDDSFYLLTLAAVAKELKRRGLAEAKVFLAVGLPLTRFGAEKNDFIKYLTKNKRVSFKYENESYHIEIDDVAVFPQCYAAVVDKIPAMAKKTLIVDIGSWTIDIMPVINKSQSAETLFRGMSKAEPQREIFGILPQEAKGEIRMQRFITDERTGIQYELIGDYYYPCLTIENEELPTLTKYGRMRERYLREHRKILYINLLTSGKLYEHLADIDTSACNMAEYLIKEMARKQGVTEQLKAENMMRWVGLMNNIRACADEIVLNDIVYS